MTIISDCGKIMMVNTTILKTKKTYKMRRVGREVNALEVTVPASLIEQYASREGISAKEFIQEYKILWTGNEDNISVEFVKEKVEAITSNEFLQEHKWRGKNMLWESILAKLKPDEVIKFECDTHQRAKHKQSSLLGSIRKSRNKQFFGKITTNVLGNILYIRLKNGKE